MIDEYKISVAPIGTPKIVNDIVLVSDGVDGVIKIYNNGSVISHHLNDCKINVSVLLHKLIILFHCEL